MSEPSGDAILIEELELAVYVGVPAEERATPQRVTVSVTMWPRTGFAQAQDDIARTVDYAAVAESVKAFCSRRPDKLIETLADAIATHLLAVYAINRVRIELRKFVLPDAKFVAVVCERSI